MRFSLSFLKKNNKVKKYLFRFLLLSFLFGVITFVIGLTWITNYSWSSICSKEEMSFNGHKVNQSPKLPNNFYRVYDIIRPNQRKISMFEQVYHSVFRPRSRYDCKCDDIGYILWSNKNLILKADLSSLLKSQGCLKFGFGLESYSSPQKCFDYWINKSILMDRKQLKNLNELSTKVMSKEIVMLDDYEILKLIAWHDILNRGPKTISLVNERYNILKIEYNRKVTFNTPLEKGKKDKIN